MCVTIKEKLKVKSFTGYKVVIKSTRGRYYSPSTGIEYVVGEPVRGTNKSFRRMRNRSCWIDPLEDRHYYMDNYFGRTAVFKNISSAKDNVGSRTIIIKMTLSDDLRNGNYGFFGGSSDKVVSGKFIKNIEEIKY